MTFFLHQCKNIQTNFQKTFFFDVIHHALKIQRKTVVQTKLKQHFITGFYYLLHMQALKKTQKIDEADYFFFTILLNV